MSSIGMNLPIELLISLRYIFPKKRNLFIFYNTIFAVLSVALAVCSLIVVTSIMDGFGKEIKDRIIGIGAHVQIQKFLGEETPEKTSALLSSQPFIKHISPFIYGNAINYYAGDTYLFSMYGVDQDKERDIINLQKYLISGQFSLKKKGIVIGKELANSYSIKIGDKITLFSPTTKGFTTFKIRGIFYSGMYLYDRNLLFIDIKDADEFFHMQGRITGFKINAKNEFQVNQIKAKLRTLLGVKYDISSWMDQNRGLISALRIERNVMFIILLVMVILAGFNISSTLIMIALSKKKEIGILQSLGFSYKRIQFIFIIQGLILCLFGLIAGIICGVLMALNINIITNVFEYFTGAQLFPKDIYYFDKIPVTIDINNILLIVMFALLISLIAAYYPSLKASRLSAVEALKNE